MPNEPDRPEKGWWPDPGGSNRLRWWDGEAWTKRLMDAPADPDAATDWDPPVAPDQVHKKDASAGASTRRRPSKRQALTALAVLVLSAGLLTAAFFVGQGTRKSDEQIRAEKQAAVAAKVLATRRTDRAEMKKAITETKRRNRTVVRRVVKKWKKVADRKAKESYASGSSAGYSSGQQSGYAAGTENGLTKGSDDLTCSDDPDVYWLPACNY